MTPAEVYRWLAAGETGREDEVKAGLAHHPEWLHAADALGENVLHKAAYRGALPVIAHLIQAGIELEYRAADGGSALHLAVRGAQPAAARALLAAGIAVDGVDGEGRTALFLAPTAACAAVLLEAGADPNHADRRGRRPLHGLVERDDDMAAEVVRQLLRCQAAPGAPDHDGNTPLHCTGCAEHVWLLTGAGARCGALNRNGESALELAIRRLCPGVVRALLGAGAVTTRGRIREALEEVARQASERGREIEALLAPHLVTLRHRRSEEPIPLLRRKE